MDAKSVSVASGQESVGQLRVVVLDANDKPLRSARLSLRPLQNGGRGRRVRYDKAAGRYHAEEMPQGRYLLSAQAKGFQGQEREIEVSSAPRTEAVLLAREGELSFYRGTVKVPFEPRRDLLAATIRPDADERQEAELLARCEQLRLRPEELPEEAREQGIRLFRFSGRVSERAMREALRGLLALPWVEFAGPVLTIGERSVSYLMGEVIVAFQPHVSESDARSIAEGMGLQVRRRIPYSPNTYHLAAPEPVWYDFLDLIARLAQREDVQWAEPNIVATAEADAIVPSDFLWPGVWDRRLAELEDAWQVLEDEPGVHRYGSPDVVIAVVDQGIDQTHPDFSGTVSDGSSKIAMLYDFRTLVANNNSLVGSHGMGCAGVATAQADNPSAVPGVAEGIAGSAPNCRLMGLIPPFGRPESDYADMYIWAAGFDPGSSRPGFPGVPSPAVDVFSTSYGFGAGAPISNLAAEMLNFLTAYGRAGKGCICCFSTGNANTNIFPTHRPWAAHPRTIAVAASTLDTDGVTEIRAPTSGWGEEIEVCAPSHRGAPHNPPQTYRTWSTAPVGGGTLPGHPLVQTVLTAPAAAGATVVVVADTTGLAAGDRLMLELPGAPGNEVKTITGAPDPATGQVPVQALFNAHAAGAAAITGPADYLEFGGTSSATPLVAGVAALMLSARPDLTWVELRQLLRDTAAKINPTTTEQHPTNPAGDFRWRDAAGNPALVTGLPPVFSPGYGYGRLNAAAAVAATVAYGFTRDLVLRENLADVGTVPSTGPFWNSPDIWVRNTDPAIDGGALPAGYAIAGPHEPPIAGQPNWIYTRVRNIGTEDSLDYRLRVYLAHFPGFEFTYPSSFIPTNGPGQPVPTPMTPGTYLLGEAFGTALPAGADETFVIEWPLDLMPPKSVTVSGVEVVWHPCLLAEVSPHDGPLPTGPRVWDSNNLAQKNIPIVYPDASGDFAVGAVMGHPEDDADLVYVEIDRGHVPPGVELYLDVVDRKAKEFLRSGHEQATPGRDPGHRGWVLTFLEAARVRFDPPSPREIAGPVLHVAAGTRIEGILRRAVPPPRANGYRVGHHEGREVAFLAKRGATRVPVRKQAGGLQPVIVGGNVPPSLGKGVYPLHLVQKNAAGEVTGGMVIEVRVER